MPAITSISSNFSLINSEEIKTSYAKKIDDHTQIIHIICCVCNKNEGKYIIKEKQAELMCKLKKTEINDSFLNINIDNKQ